MDRSVIKYQELFSICYQIAGSAVNGGMEVDDDQKLLLNTLSNPDGPGADILLRNEGPYQDVMDEALSAETQLYVFGDSSVEYMHINWLKNDQ